MKNKNNTTKLIFIFFVSIFLLASCTSTSDLDKTDIWGRPLWTKNNPNDENLIYGVGNASLYDHNMSVTASKSVALIELDNNIRKEIEHTILCSDLNENDSQNLLTVMRKLNLVFNLVKMERIWTDNKGNVWTLLSFQKKDLAKLYEHSVEVEIKKLEQERRNFENKITGTFDAINEQDNNSQNEIIKKISEECSRYYESNRKQINELKESILKMNEAVI